MNAKRTADEFGVYGLAAGKKICLFWKDPKGKKKQERPLLGGEPPNAPSK